MFHHIGDGICGLIFAYMIHLLGLFRFFEFSCSGFLVL